MISMNKDLKTVLLKLILLASPFFVLLTTIALALKNEPMRFFDGEYSWYYQNMEYAQGHEDYCRVLIMGDSAAKAGWLPDELTGDTYNFSIGGATSIEEYYCLQDYLKNNQKPEYLIYTQNLSHFFEVDCFWTRGVYFHRLRPSDVLDTYLVGKRIGDETTLFGEKELVDIPLYYTYSPIYYSSAFTKGIMASREDFNMERYSATVSDKGRVEFGSNNSNWKEQTIPTIEYDSFDYNKLIDHYFRQLIKLCKKNDIEFIYQSAPMTSIIYESLNETLVEEYNAYMQKIREEHPGAIINSDLFVYENDQLFSDAVHLSREGAELFSRSMKDKYTYIFEEEA